MQITLKVYKINISSQTKVTLKQSPGYLHILSNKKAYNLTQQATRVEVAENQLALYPILQSVALEKRSRIFLFLLFLWINLEIGRFIYNFDKVFSRKHTFELYNRKSHVEAAILCQLRSEIYKLNKYLARIGIININIYSYKRKSESVNNFFFQCQLWHSQRESLYKLASKFKRWGNPFFALEAWSREIKDDDQSKWKPSLEMVVATVKFALETKKLVEKWSREKAKKSDSNISSLGKGKEDSNNKEDGLGAV